MTTEPKLTIPRAIGWQIITAILTFLVTSTWVGRGIYAKVEEVGRQQSSLAAEVGATNTRVNAMENKMSAYDERFTYIIDALRRQEMRSGYTPPPPPPVAD